MSDTFVTLAEAEEITGVAQETLKKRCQSGLIKGVFKKGKTWFVPTISLIGTLRPKVGVYIDGSNIYKGGQSVGWQLDYRKLKEFIERRYEISIISYYNSTGYKQNSSGKYQKDEMGKYILDEGAQNFEKSLKGMGIRL